MQQDPNCIFCKIIAGEIPASKVYEDENYIAFADIKPVNLGHCLVVPKDHSENLLSMTEESLTKLGPVIQKVAQAVKSGTGAAGINLGMNNGAVAGQLVPHSHIHIIPRFEGDGLVHWPGKDYSPEELRDVTDKIKTSL